MTIQLQYKPLEICNPRRFPAAGFEIFGQLKNASGQLLAVYGATAICRLPGQVEQPVIALPPVGQLRAGGESGLRLNISVTRELLKAAESQRDPRAGEVSLWLQVSVTAAPMIQIAKDVWVPGSPESASVEIPGRGSPYNYYISRDQWLDILRGVGYSETEVFELPAPKPPKNEITEEAFRLLRGAVEQFRRGNWDVTLAECHRAMESLVKSVGDNKRLKQAFEKFWLRVHPEEWHHEKRSALDDIAGGLSDFHHLGRHVDQPPYPVDREDALLSLRMTMSLFEYIGQRLVRSQ